MTPGRLVAIISAGEGLMLAIAVVSARLAGIAFPLGDMPTAIAGGVAGALALTAINLSLLRWTANRWPGGALRLVCRTIVRPLFVNAGPWHILAVSVLAGFGEELLFRGVLQPTLGLAVASVLFGAVHVGGRDFLGYGVWAACIGAFLGWITLVTGGLLAAIVAHALYDAVALAYVRFGPTDLCKN